METKTVRISKEAFDHVKSLSEAEKRTFINQLDWELFSKKTPKKEPVSRFVKPDKTEVYFYIQENGYSVNVEDWFNHYESNGWKVGKNPMKDWKAAVRTWEKFNKEKEVKQKQGFQLAPTAEVYTEPHNIVKQDPINKEQFYARAKKEARERNTRTGGGTRLKNILYGNNGKE